MSSRSGGQTEKAGKFRFFQPYTKDAAKLRMDRDALIGFFTYTQVKQALKQPIIQTDQKSGKEFSSEKLIKLIRSSLPQLFEAVQSDLMLSEALLTISDRGIDKEDTEKNKNIDEPERRFTLDYFEEGQFKVDRDDDGEITWIFAEKAIHSDYGSKGEPKKLIKAFGKPPADNAEADRIDSDKIADLRFAIHIQTIPSDVIGKGRAWIEPMWDDAFGLNRMSSGSILYAIRNSADLRAFRAKKRFIEQNGDLIKSQLRGTDAEDSVIAIPIIEDSAGKTIELESLTASSRQLNMEDLWKRPFSRVAAYSGTPQSKIEGITLGQQTGEEYSERDMFDVYKDIQDKYEFIYYKWFTVLRDDFDYTDLIPPELDIGFEERKDLTEIGQANLLKANLENVGMLQKYMSIEDAFRIAKIDVKGIKLEKPEPIAFGENPEETNGQPAEDETSPPDLPEDKLTEPKSN